MKVKAVRLLAGGIKIELVAETPFELVLLEEAWAAPSLTRGYGNSTTPSGDATGFYIDVGRSVKETGEK